MNIGEHSAYNKRYLDILYIFYYIANVIFAPSSSPQMHKGHTVYRLLVTTDRLLRYFQNTGRKM